MRRACTSSRVRLTPARVFGRERARLRRMGTPVSDLDLLIAATAIYYGSILLTAHCDLQPGPGPENNGLSIEALRAASRRNL